MITKFLEVRDEATCIPVLAIKMEGEGALEARYLWRCGYPDTGNGVVLMKLMDQKATSDLSEWDNRTMQVAHQYIEEHFNILQSGQVVDVRVILGEAPEPAAPEIWSKDRKLSTQLLGHTITGAKITQEQDTPVLHSLFLDNGKKIEFTKPNWEVDGTWATVKDK